MLDRFDLYHKWLGIPPHEQPANYYRLLGLELFESDLDAIECAADRLIKYVRDVATVEQRQPAREILDELSAAKRCLLNVEQKQAYDAGLRAGRAATHSKRTEPARKTETPVAVHVTAIDPKPRTVPHRQPTSEQPSRRLIVIAAAIALVVVSGLCFVFLRGNSAPTKQAAEISEVLETSEILQQSDVSPSAATARTATTPDRETPEHTAETIVPKVEKPAAEPPLPEFVSQTPVPEPASNSAEPNAKPSETAAPTEPEETTEAKSESEPSAEPVVAATSERGGLLREVWTNVIGNKVEEFVQYVAEHSEPNQTDTIDRFEPPEDFGDQYGQRLRGYLHPPTTGSYEFSMRANAEGWLYVSTDATPENKRRVEPGTKIELEAGQAYYVEAFHKESTGRDYLSIGWTLPDATEEKPIPGERLSIRYRVAPRHESEFVVLTPLSAESSLGTKLDLLDDGVIAATGPSSDNETYRLTFESEMETITAVRLEAIPHESLPASGPGRGIGGRFALADLSVTVASRVAPDAAQPWSFASAVDDAGHDLRRIVDGDEKTVWRAPGRGEPAAVALIVQDPTSFTDGTTVKVEVQQREAVGRFRLLATSAPDPRSALRPSGTIGDGALYSLYVNLGGDDFTAPDGVRWRASKRFDNETFGHEGGRGVSEDLIANKVQGTAQRGIAAFRAVVPAGAYEVTLYFCEYWSTTPSSRRFAIAVEQRVVEPNFDLFRFAGGMAKPLVYPIRNCVVQDGRLDVEFREAGDGASTILNAVRIQQVR
ncbi:MAG: malectin domain-containing carbohydrate-binding protein [Planctomycetota bacterium]|nr:malectin domain-containing carbohydrate-binding protein [Planctomycetota bacterium]